MRAKAMLTNKEDNGSLNAQAVSIEGRDFDYAYLAVNSLFRKNIQLNNTNRIEYLLEEKAQSKQTSIGCSTLPKQVT